MSDREGWPIEDISNVEWSYCRKSEFLKIIWGGGVQLRSVSYLTIEKEKPVAKLLAKMKTHRASSTVLGD